MTPTTPTQRLARAVADLPDTFRGVLDLLSAYPNEDPGPDRTRSRTCPLALHLSRAAHLEAEVGRSVCRVFGPLPDLLHADTIPLPKPVRDAVEVLDHEVDHA